MSEFRKVSTLDDLEALDDADVAAGYRAGKAGAPEPGNTQSRSYWHGWRNGMADSGRMAIDREQLELARQAVAAARRKGMH